jgi:hypothetical protein
MAKILIAIGILLIIIGTIIQFAPWMLNWFGKLPGDINIQSERSRVFIPVTSMLILSIIMSIIANLIKYLKK